MNAKSKAHFYRQLGQLVGSGFHLDRSVDLLLGQDPDAGTRRLLEKLRQGLTAGAGIGAAYRDEAASLTTELECALVDSGERSGRLAESCAHLADYFDTEHRSRQAVQGALIYPLILAHVGVVLPVLTTLFQSSLAGQSFSLLPAVLLRLAGLWVMLLLLALAWKALSKAARTSPAADRLLMTVPLIGKVRRHWALGRFCQVFHSTLLAALRVSEGLRSAGNASQSGAFMAGAELAARQVDAGKTLAEGLKESDAFPKIFTDSIQAAEMAGTLDMETARWARSETEFAISSQKRVADALPKMVYLIVVLYVASGIIRFFLGYFGEITRLGNSI